MEKRDGVETKEEKQAEKKESLSKEDKAILSKKMSLASFPSKP